MINNYLSICLSIYPPTVSIYLCIVTSTSRHRPSATIAPQTGPTPVGWARLACQKLDGLSVVLAARFSIYLSIYLVLGLGLGLGLGLKLRLGLDSTSGLGLGF